MFSHRPPGRSHGATLVIIQFERWRIFKGNQPSGFFWGPIPPMNPPKDFFIRIQLNDSPMADVFMVNDMEHG